MSENEWFAAVLFIFIFALGVGLVAQSFGVALIALSVCLALALLYSKK